MPPSWSGFSEARISDMRDSLEEGRWISDDVIEGAVNSWNAVNAAGGKRQLHFMSPSLAQTFQVIPSIVRANLPNEARNAQWIFSPINDSQEPIDRNARLEELYGRADASGTHWMLLGCERRNNASLRFHFYDSASAPHESLARQRAHAIHMQLNPAASADFVTHKTPQQENGSDCGIHVLATCQLFQDRFNSRAPMQMGDIDKNVLDPYRIPLRRNLRESLEQRISSREIQALDPAYPKKPQRQKVRPRLEELVPPRGKHRSRSLPPHLSQYQRRSTLQAIQRPPSKKRRIVRARGHPPTQYRQGGFRQNRISAQRGSTLRTLGPPSPKRRIVRIRGRLPNRYRQGAYRPARLSAQRGSMLRVIRQPANQHRVRKPSFTR